MYWELAAAAGWWQGQICSKAIRHRRQSKRAVVASGGGRRRSRLLQTAFRTRYVDMRMQTGRLRPSTDVQVMGIEVASS